MTSTEAGLIDEVEYWIDHFIRNGKFKYEDQMRQLMAVANTGPPIYKIAHHELSDVLALGILNKPDEYIDAIRQAIIKHYRDKDEPEFAAFLQDKLEIEITEMELTNTITKDNLDKLTRIQGQITGIEPIHQVQKFAKYRCVVCEREMTTRICPDCRKKTGEMIITADSLEEQRFIEIKTIDSSTWLDLRGSKAFFTPNFGDTVDITGIVKISNSQEKQPLPFNTFFLYIQVLSISAYHEDDRKIKVTPELMQERRQFIDKCIEQGLQPEKVLADKIAPMIHGQDTLKLSLLYQGVSGCVNNVGERTELHILVMKNPSEAKSELAMYMTNVTDGGYFSSEGVSAVGLTVGLVDDARTKKKIAKAGQAIIFNKKCKYMDEIDKIPEREYFNQLNTVLDKGFYTETKILNKTFETRGPWCMWGNFRKQTYDDSQSLMWNVNLPSSLMSRFDLYHIECQNEYNAEKQDAKMEKQSDRFIKGKKIMQVDLGLKQHIACAMSITEVTFEPEVKEKFKQFFHQMKTLEKTLDSGLKITDRQFSTLWRVAIARAVLHLRNEVTKEDAQAAIDHVWQVLSTVGIDNRTGNVDLGVLSGTSKSTNNRLKALKIVFSELAAKYEDTKIDYVLSALISSGNFKDEADARLVLQEGRQNMVIQDSSRAGYIRYIG